MIVFFSFLFFSFFSLTYSQEKSQKTIDHLLEGNDLYQQKQYKKAIKHYKLAIEKEQNTVFAWHNLALSYVQLKQIPKAIQSEKRSVEISPLFIESWRNLADLFYLISATEEAISHYKRVLELDSSYIHAWNSLGESYLKLNSPIDALFHFEQSLKLNADQIDIYYALAETYAKIEDFNQAQKMIQEALILSPSANSSVYFYLGYLYEQSNLDNKAISTYEEGLSLDPKHLNIYKRIAFLHEKNNRLYLSLIALDYGLETFPNKGLLFYEKGLIYLKLSHNKKALDSFNKSLKNNFTKAKQMIKILKN